jgi:hypothetical protein
VTLIHEALDRLVADGVPSDRVVVGGFSQGGAAALAGGLSYPRRLAGLVSISGWTALRSGESLARTVHLANGAVPIFFSAGTADRVVAFPLARRSYEALAAALPDAHVTFAKVDRGGHPPKKQELLAATAFIRAALGGKGGEPLSLPIKGAAPEAGSKAGTARAAASSAVALASVTSKGERALRQAAVPDVVEPLPLSLRREATIRYDLAAHADLFRAVAALLHSLGGDFLVEADGAQPAPPDADCSADGGCLSRAPPADSERRECAPLTDVLESYRPRSGAAVFTSFRLRQQLYAAAAQDAPLLAAYDHLVHTVVLPFLKARLLLAEGGGEAAAAAAAAGDGASTTAPRSSTATSFHVQRPPSIRVQPPDQKAFCRAHRDAEYGHQEGEVNFWMPLTGYARTQTTLWVESAPGSADFHPLELAPGEIAAFHGTLLHHRVPPNVSACTRVSLDFRVGVGKFFDPEWRLREAKAQHTRQEVVC